MATHRWESIEAFERVVRHGSFSRAAEELGVSRSHISRQITTLDNRLDAQLLLRTTRRVYATEVGQAFYLRCREILCNLGEVEHGLGLVQLPSFYLQEDIGAGNLATVLDDYNPTDTGVWAVYPHNRHLTAKFRLFVNFLAERF